MASPERFQVTFLPMQLRRLADLADVVGGVFGIRQDDTVLHIQTNAFSMSIDAMGETIEGSMQYKPRPNQGQLC